MDLQNKQNYLNEVTRLRVLEELVKETQEKIYDDFINYYRTENQADIEAIEAFRVLPNKVERLKCIFVPEDIADEIREYIKSIS